MRTGSQSSPLAVLRWPSSVTSTTSRTAVQLDQQTSTNEQRVSNVAGLVTYLVTSWRFTCIQLESRQSQQPSGMRSVGCDLTGRLDFVFCKWSAVPFLACTNPPDHMAPHLPQLIQRDSPACCCRDLAAAFALHQVRPVDRYAYLTLLCHLGFTAQQCAYLPGKLRGAASLRLMPFCNRFPSRISFGRFNAFGWSLLARHRRE